MANSAVGLDRVSRIVGYKLTTGDFRSTSPNLPQRIAVLAEANEANQSGLDLTPTQITSAQQAGDLYGYGSPIYLIARILIPQQGGGVNGIPVWIYPQAKASGATAKKITITPTGTATQDAVHTLVIAGRYSMEGQSYDVNITAGDTASEITDKISDLINDVLGCPFNSTEDDYVVTCTSKWNGDTADDLTISVDTNDADAGITYTIASTQSGTGVPSVQSALNSFGNNWNTIVVNSYGADTGTLTLLENFNGVPSATNPTGRYVGTIMKPFVAIYGTCVDDPTSITDARKTQVTNAAGPTPNSLGLPLEGAANYAVLYANNSQNTPHLDINNQALPDMPTPDDIGSMADYNNRDLFVKKGCSTVDLVAGQYVVQDFVTTYHPTGENPPQFRYCRNLMLDFNIRYGYYLLEQINVVDHAISADSDIVSVQGVIKPKQWKQIVTGYADDLSKRALIVDPQFMKDSITVALSSSNPDRLETFFKYKRSGVVRIASTEAQAGFNFGVLV